MCFYVLFFIYLIEEERKQCYFKMKLYIILNKFVYEERIDTGVQVFPFRGT